MSLLLVNATHSTYLTPCLSSSVHRCVRSERRVSHREPPGEVPVRSGGVLPHPVPQSAHPLRQAPPPATVAEDRQLAGHRAAILRPPRGKDAYRDPDSRHAPERVEFLVALHELDVTALRVAAAGELNRLRRYALIAL